MRGWTPHAREHALAARREKRDAKREAQGLPLESIGPGRPRRSRGGLCAPRCATPLQMAVLEVRHDLERGYHSPARFIARTEYKLHRDEFTLYREGWSAIKQAIEDGVADLL